MKSDRHLPAERACSGYDTGPSGTEALETLLHEKMPCLSKADRRLAAYILTNITGMQFETGASIARAVGVSEMTVSRFIRTVGFDNLKQLKQSLRFDRDQRHRDMDDYVARFQLQGPRQTERQESLRLEMEAVAKAYALANSPAWDEAVGRLAEAKTVYVTGFHVCKGLAMDLAARLRWIRPHVVFVFSDTGFGEVLTADPDSSVVIMVDTATYAKRGLKLAERLKARQIPLVILTDRYSLWGWTYSKWVFEAHTFVKTFWDSTAGLAVLANLLMDDVATRLGSRVKAHNQGMTEAVQSMGDHVGRQFHAQRG